MLRCSGVQEMAGAVVARTARSELRTCRREATEHVDSITHNSIQLKAFLLKAYRLGKAVISRR